jgi:hypothetical protein
VRISARPVRRTEGAVVRALTNFGAAARSSPVRVQVAGHVLIPGITVRSAVVRTRVHWPTVLWAVTLRPAVARACILWPSVGGRDQGQRPEQQADEHLGAQQVHETAHAGRLHSLCQGTDPRPGGGCLRGLSRNRPDSEAVPSWSPNSATHALRCASWRRRSAAAGSAASTARCSDARSCPVVWCSP